MLVDVRASSQKRPNGSAGARTRFAHVTSETRHAHVAVAACIQTRARWRANSCAALTVHGFHRHFRRKLALDELVRDFDFGPIPRHFTNCDIGEAISFRSKMKESSRQAWSGSAKTKTNTMSKRKLSLAEPKRKFWIAVASADHVAIGCA